jgi:hypothetical protein
MEANRLLNIERNNMFLSTLGVVSEPELFFQTTAKSKKEIKAVYVVNAVSGKISSIFDSLICSYSISVTFKGYDYSYLQPGYKRKRSTGIGIHCKLFDKRLFNARMVRNSFAIFQLVAFNTANICYRMG